MKDLAPKSRRTIVLDLFNQYYERVYAFVRKSCSMHQAEDIAQDVFTKLLEIEDLQDRTIQISYLLKIAQNLIRRRYARSMRLMEIIEEKIVPGLEQNTSDRDRMVLDSKKLTEGMSLLTSNEQDTIRMIVCEGLSYEAAAEALNVKISTINNWKHRGISKLRDFCTGSSMHTDGRSGMEAIDLTVHA